MCVCARLCVCVYICSLTATTPHTKAEFGTAEQGKYKAAVAAAARTAAANVDIVSVTDTEGQRRAGSVEVLTKVIVERERASIEVDTKVTISLLLLADSLLALCCSIVSLQR